jgi:hypothetical protein
MAEMALSAAISEEIFQRSGRIQKITVRVPEQQLFAE